MMMFTLPLLGYIVALVLGANPCQASEQPRFGHGFTAAFYEKLISNLKTNEANLLSDDTILALINGFPTAGLVRLEVGPHSDALCSGHDCIYVDALDSYLEETRKAVATRGDKNVRFMIAQASALVDVKNAEIDRIVMKNIPYGRHYAQSIAEFKRVLKSSGIVILLCDRFFDDEDEEEEEEDENEETQNYGYHDESNNSTVNLNAKRQDHRHRIPEIYEHEIMNAQKYGFKVIPLVSPSWIGLLLASEIRN